MDEVNLQILNCSRCGWKWIPRSAPVQCPKCKSYYWNENKDFDRRKAEYKKQKIKEVRKVLNEN